MYIYKLGTECAGAQMRASDVYVPTLVALLGLCFDPSECFRDLRVWSGVVGNKSGKLRYVLWIVTTTTTPPSTIYLYLAHSLTSFYVKFLLDLFFPCFALFVHLPFPLSDHFAVTVASSGFYATALYITDCMPFAVLQKIDLTVVPTT